VWVACLNIIVRKSPPWQDRFYCIYHAFWIEAWYSASFSPATSYLAGGVAATVPLPTCCLHQKGHSQVRSGTETKGVLDEEVVIDEKTQVL
jgi:hypothetical protein